MGVIINEGNQGQAGFLSLDVAKLEETTREAMASWFADNIVVQNLSVVCDLL